MRPVVPETFDFSNIYIQAISATIRHVNATKQWDPLITYETKSPGLIDRSMVEGLSPLFDIVDSEADRIDPETGRTPYLRRTAYAVLFGTTELGNSVCVRFPFKPSIVLQPHNTELWPTNAALTEQLCRKFRVNNTSDIVCSSETLFRTDGWWDDNTGHRKSFPMVRVSCVSMGLARQISKWFQTDARVANRRAALEATVHEDKVSGTLQITDVCGIEPGGWIQVRGGTPVREHASMCQIEVTVPNSSHVTNDPSHTAMAPLLIASIDGEMYSSTGKFPNATNPKDVVIGIGICFQQGERVEKHYISLGPCSPIKDVVVHSMRSETALLRCYADLIRIEDPDLLIGYNISGFDFGYFADRLVDVPNESFYRQGRLWYDHTSVTEQRFSSNAYGDNVNRTMDLSGRIVLDMFVYVKRGFLLRMYKLGFVSQHFLKEDKVDLSPHELFQAYEKGGADGQARIGHYCVQDTWLPIRLMNHLMVLPSVMEMARITKTWPQAVVSRGQQERVFNQLLVFAHRYRFALTQFECDMSSTETYEGATVIECRKGFYPDPVVLLDWKSLYPSCIKDKNLSHDTLVIKGRPLHTETNSIVHSEHLVDQFVTSEEGLLPRICTFLLDARAAVRKRMKTETDDKVKTMLDARQIAFKVSTNSIYGFTGASTSPLPCLPVARSTAAIGRKTLELTQSIVEKECLTKNGPVETIAGDTDSVMVLCKGLTVKEAHEWGDKTALTVSQHFRKAMELEKDGVFCPMLNMQKKNYAYVLYATPTSEPELKSKGMMTVRRSTTLWVSNICDEVLNTLMYKRSQNAAVEYIMNQLWALEDGFRTGTLDYSLFEITSSLRAEYKRPDTEPQYVVSQQIKRRAPGSEPHPGDRLGYVVLQGCGALATRVDETSYARDNRLKLDVEYYITNHLTNAIASLFDPFGVDTSKLFEATLRVLRHKRTGQVSLVPEMTNRRTIPTLKPLVKKRPRVPKKKSFKAKKRKVVITGSMNKFLQQ